MRRIASTLLLLPLLLGPGCFSPPDPRLIGADGTSGGVDDSSSGPGSDGSDPSDSGTESGSTGGGLPDPPTGPAESTTGDESSTSTGDGPMGSTPGESGDGSSEGEATTTTDDPVEVIDADYYVDAAAEGGDGSLEAPFTTITQALAVAQSGEVVAAFPGVYDAELGESFPLQIPTGVTLVGDPPDRGAGSSPTVISGHAVIEGDFQAAIVPGVNTEVRGFTIEGGTELSHFGVFVETNAILAENTHASSYGGVRLAGGAPMIELSTFETSSYGVSGCFGTGTIHDNRFVTPALNVDLQGTGPCTVSDNLIEGTGQVGIQNQGGSHVITGNTFDMPNGYTYGCLSTSGSSMVRDNDCDIDQGPAVRITSAGSPDLGVPGEAGNNILGHVNAVGIVLEGSASVTARGNAWATPSPSCGDQIVVEGTGTVWWGNGPQDFCD